MPAATGQITTGTVRILLSDNANGYVVADAVRLVPTTAAAGTLSSPDIDTDRRHRGANGSFDGHSRGDGVFYRMDDLRRLRPEHIGDGTSGTLLIGEDVPQRTQWRSWHYSNNATGTWATPPNVRRPGGGEYPLWGWQTNESFRSRHVLGLHFAFANGSVQWLDDDIALHVYRALATLGGEVAAAP